MYGRVVVDEGRREVKVRKWLGKEKVKSVIEKRDGISGQEGKGTGKRKDMLRCSHFRH